LIQYVVEKKIYQRLKAKGKLFCRKCYKELKIGDAVKSVRSNGKAKIYHCKCFESLFLDIKD